MFVDVIGIVVHVSNIRGRDDVRIRPYRYMVLMNENVLRLKILSLLHAINFLLFDANQFCNS